MGDQFFRNLICSYVAKTSDAREGVKLQIVLSGETAKKPIARIWFTEIDMSKDKFTQSMRLQTPRIPVGHWMVIKKEEPK